MRFELQPRSTRGAAPPGAPALSPLATPLPPSAAPDYRPTPLPDVPEPVPDGDAGRKGDEVILLEGTLERVTYHNPENGYSVMRLQPPGKGTEIVTVIGYLAEPAPGVSLRLTGAWENNPRFGRQFKAATCVQVVPSTIEGLRRYLGSGLVRGIGSRMADRIVDYFGADTLQVLDHQPERLREVSGIGRKRVAEISRAWHDQQTIREIMLFLQSHNISTSLAVKIHARFGEQAISTVQSDPYCLAREISGVGFLTADRVARSLGVPLDAPARIEAGTLYALDTRADDGHVYVPRDELVTVAKELLKVPVEPVSAAVDRICAERYALRETLPLANGPVEAVYPRRLYYAEIGVAGALRGMIADPASRLGLRYGRLDWGRFFGDLAHKPGMVALSDQQQTAIRTALTRKITVVTGGPGTGKSTSLKALILALEANHQSYVLASPTGRAAKRMTEATGRPAMTVHRLLGYRPGQGFEHHAHNRLDADMVIIDETSMLDVEIARALFAAVSPQAHLLLIGDVDQLPSVGPGNVLGDLITAAETAGASGIAVVRLDTIFRQAANSAIITNSHRVRQGQTLEIPPGARDFYFVERDGADEAAGVVVEMAANRIPREFGFDPFEVQVLSPMYRGPAGVTALNARLQALLNPPGPEKGEQQLASGRILRAGDKVLQSRNDYDREVFNGDVGLLREVDPVAQRIVAEFDGRPVEYGWANCDELMPAYALSIHRAQGSEYPAVVIPVVNAHHVMLQRNLLYTAITRARRLVVLVGQTQAVAIAVANNDTARRWTALDLRMRRAARVVTLDELAEMED